MTSFTDSITHAVVIRNSKVWKNPWFCESLEQAEAKAEECRNALKPHMHDSIEVLELVRVA